MVDLSKITDALGGLSKPKKAIGVDIGSHSVKIIELENNKGKLVLTNYAYLKTGESLVEIGTAGVLSDATGEVVKKALESMGIKSDSVNVAVPNFSSLLTVFDLPMMAESEVDQAVRVEAPKYIPVNLSDVVYGSQIVDKDISKETGRVKVLVVAIMKDISNRYEEVFGNAGMSIDSIEVDSFSLVRSLLRKNRECNLILDIGHKVTNLIVARNGDILLSRTIDVAGDSITSVVERSMGVDSSRAEQIKIKNGLNGNDNASASLQEIANEIKKTIDVLNDQFTGIILNRIVLSGGSSRLIGLPDYLSKELSLEVVYGNPFSAISCPEKLKDVLTQKASFFGVAVGLAMLSFE